VRRWGGFWEEFSGRRLCIVTPRVVLFLSGRRRGGEEEIGPLKLGLKDVKSAEIGWENISSKQKKGEVGGGWSMNPETRKKKRASQKKKKILCRKEQQQPEEKRHLR